MKKIFKTKVGRLSNDSLALLALRIIDTVTKSNIVAANTSKQFLELIEVNNRFKATVRPKDAKQTSINVAQKFNERQTLFIDIYDYLFGLLKAPETELKDAATALFVIIDRYGRNFSTLKIADQSVRYIRIIEALKSNEMATALQKTLLTAKVDELDAAQRAYEELYVVRGNVKLITSAPSTVRVEMENAIKLHVEEVQWMTRQAGTDEWKMLEATIDARIGEMTVTASKAKTESSPEVQPAASDTKSEDKPAA